jgi:hypothetical protein
VPSYELPIRASPQIRQLERIIKRSPSWNSSREKPLDAFNLVDMTFTYSAECKTAQPGRLFNTALPHRMPGFLFGYPSPAATTAVEPQKRARFGMTTIRGG